MIRFIDCPFKNSTFVVPGDGLPHPGILLLHGAEGGGAPFWKMTAMLYASLGYASLAYCYFGRNDSLWGPRETLANFELMELHDAMTLLSRTPEVLESKVAVSGASRGAELALLFASLISGENDLLQPAAVLAHCPSDETYGSWNLDWEDDRCWLKKDPEHPSRGEHPGPSSVWNPRCGQDPRSLPDDMKTAWKWKGRPIVAGTRIEVEKIRSPTFISHGTADDVWSVEKTRRIETAMRNAGLDPEVHYFEGEGHSLGLAAGERRMNHAIEFLNRTWKST